MTLLELARYNEDAFARFVEHGLPAYTVQVCRAGWLVKRDADGLVVSHGHATRESAEAFVRAAPS